MLRTGIRAQIFSASPRFAFYVRKVWKNEIRLSLSLTDIASCEAVSSTMSGPLIYRLTYRPVEDNSARAFRARCDSKPVILSTLTLRDLTLELSLYAVGILLSRASKMPGRDGDIPARLTTLPLALADHAKKVRYRHSTPSSRPCHSWRAS